MTRFCRVFWAFGSQLKAFSYCCPLLNIDGTHLLKNKDIATEIGADRGLYIFAFAVVESKSEDY